MTQGKMEQRLRDLAGILENIEGITTRVTGGKVVIEGELFREEDLSVINRLTEQHRTIVNLSRVSPVLLRIRTGSLAPGIALHSAYNGVLVAVGFLTQTSL